MLHSPIELLQYITQNAASNCPNIYYLPRKSEPEMMYIGEQEEGTYYMYLLTLSQTSPGF